MQMELLIMENGKMINNMEMEQKHGLMELVIKECIKMERSMVKEL